MYRRYCMRLGAVSNRTQLVLSESRAKVLDDRMRSKSSDLPRETSFFVTDEVNLKPRPATAINSYPVEGQAELDGYDTPEHQGGTSQVTMATLLLAGDVTQECPPPDKIIRIFLSSTFTDTRHERNKLMERVYPKLRKWCQVKGYEFQVVDMRWGVRDEATDDHRTTDLCLQEIAQCNKLSTGPCFVTFLSHKYGYRCFPRKFEVTEFKLLLKATTSPAAQKLLNKWFKLDENAVPPTFVLQPISFQLPGYKSKEPSVRAQAANQWWEDMEAMLEAIGQAASMCLSPERAHALVQSVTETEIRKGMLANPSLLKRSVWFYRQIDNIDTVQPDRLASRFKDCKDSDKKNRESHRLLEELKKEMAASLPADHVHKYSIKWDLGAGVDPDNNTEHSAYINQLCHDFEQQLQGLILRAVTARDNAQRASPLVEEVSQHARFCQDKCSSFNGRGDALKHTWDYLTGPSSQVMVIHGVSGCGKTSLLAMAAKQAWSVHKGQGVVIVRFLGTTAQSSNLNNLLSSILQQLMATATRHGHDNPGHVPNSLSERIDLLQELLEETASKEFPITLLLDSLDQLDPSNNARQLAWLPTALPSGVKVIVSTLPEPQYEALPKLQAIYKDDQSNFYEVPILDDKDVSTILDQWLTASQRRLTASQRQLVLEAFKWCPLPLFLKLTFDTACRWRSYFPVENTVLQATVRESIDVLLENLEGMHGQTLVSRALGYLTISQNGLTETELEDILSCDDDVLNEAYVYWTPPMRRLPPLLLSRLRADLGQYLVERGVDGVGVFYWYHRQFVEAAYDRYCSNAVIKTMLHEALAHFFAGTWAAGQAKPYKDKAGNSGKADRIVSPQPLKFSDSNYNLRKLNNLPYHAVKAGKMDLSKRECLLNFHFMLNKIEACGVRSLLDDFSMARKELPEDSDITKVAETLQLSQDALQQNPKQLPAQLICRIVSPLSQGLRDLEAQCRASEDVYLLPNQPLMELPGGQLLGQLQHSCNKQLTAQINCLVMSADGSTVITSSWRDKSLCVFDVKDGQTVMKMQELANRPVSVSLCCDDSILVTASSVKYEAYWLKTGLPTWTVTTKNSSHGTKNRVCFCGAGRSLMAVVAFEHCDLYSAHMGHKMHTIRKPISIIMRSFAVRKSMFSRTDICCVGNQRHVAITEVGCTALLIFDILEHKVVTSRLFQTDDDDDELFSSDDDDDNIDEKTLRERLKRINYRQKVRRQESKMKGEELEDKMDLFVISDVILSPDGVSVLCTPSGLDELHFLDVGTLDTTRIITGSQGDFQSWIHMTSDCQYIFFPKHNKVRVCEVKSGRMASAFTHFEEVFDVATVDMHIFVTLAKDNVLRIWDIGRGLPEGEAISALHFRDPSVPKEEGGIKSSSEQRDGDIMMSGILMMFSMSNSRYVLLLSSCDADHRYLQVYDVTKNEVVRQADLGHGTKVPDSVEHSLMHVSGTHIIAGGDGWLKTIDINTMQVMHTFPGYMRTWVNHSTLMINNNTEILTLSRHRHHLKVYCVATCRTKHLFRQQGKQLHLLNYIEVNKQSTVAVAGTDDCHSLLVFDLQSHSHLYSVQAHELRQPDLQLDEQVAITPNGRYLVLCGQTYPPESYFGGKSSGFRYQGMLLYDLQQRNLVRYLHNSSDDHKLGWKYWLVRALDDDRVLSCCLDTCSRVHNIHTGEVLWRMEGGRSSAQPFLEPNSPLLVMAVVYRANTFSVFSLPDLSFMASFSMEHKLRHFQPLPGVRDHFLAAHPLYRLPVVFTVHAGTTRNQKPSTTSSAPEMFPGYGLRHVLELQNNTDNMSDEDDMDDDTRQ